jgi:hypothetical protein
LTRTGQCTIAVLVAAASTAGCGGGAALMHPAHALPPNRMTLGAGVSNHFVVGEASEAIESARLAASPTGSGINPVERERDFITGAIAQTVTAPGLAPWVGARVGLGYTTDAGITYTGRTARVDGRHAFESGDVALSIGAGASGVLARPGHDEPTSSTQDPPPPRLGGSIDPTGEIPGLDAGDVSGFGFDVPVIVGIRSDAELFQLWVGARGGYERLSGELLMALDPGREVETASLRASRWYLGGLLGIAVGVRPIWVALELDANYQRFEGELDRAGVSSAKLEGVTLTPTGAVMAKF